MKRIYLYGTNLIIFKPLKTPVLFLIFNRPDKTQKSFEAIARVRPEVLYVSADGPRSHRPDDARLCEASRKIIEQVDWPCELHTDFSDHNLGCKEGPLKGINWLFSRHEQGIIIEDDCVPSASFFNYCEELLQKYQHDNRIMMITGMNRLVNEISDPEYSYFFSNLGEIWGWATWKRAWNHYDKNMTLWPEAKKKEILFQYLDSPAYALRLEEKFDRVYHQKITTAWDYQWLLTMALNNGLSIVPGINQVSNIGFGEDATHTRNVRHSTAFLPNYELPLPLKHPPYVVRDKRVDKLQQRKKLRPGYTFLFKNFSRLLPYLPNI